MIKKSNKKAIIFDLDDTLVPSTLAYGVALKAVGLSAADPSYKNARDLVKSRLPQGHVSARNRLLYFKELLQEQKKFSPDSLLNMMSVYENTLQNILKEEWKNSNRVTLIQELKKTYDIAILTNENTRTQMIKLRAIDPHGQLFDYVLTSEEAGCEKPSPTIFNVLLQKLQLAPEQCWMIGDDLTNDMIPAHSLGMSTCLTTEFLSPNKVQNNGDSNGAIPHWHCCISNLNKLPGILLS